MSKTHCYNYVHSSIIQNSQKLKITQMSIDIRMDKQNVLYTFSGMLFSLKKERNSDICYNMDEPWIHYAKWNKPNTKTNTVWYHLHKVPRIVKFIEPGRPAWLSEPGERGWNIGSCYLIGVEFQFCKMK